MANYKEILTKAVIGKGKKTTKEKHEVLINGVDNVLGCWVINHSFTGNIYNKNISVLGSYDINIWYSYDNNTKTNVVIKSFNYQDNMNVSLKENSSINSNSEVVVRVLNQPNVTDVVIEDNIIKIEVLKQMGIEVIGDTMVKVSVEDDLNDYEEIIDEEIDTDYLK